MSDAVDLTGLRSLTSVLERLPNGESARTLADNLGVWHAGLHRNVADRQVQFPTGFADKGDGAVSDLNAYWVSELFRATELGSLIRGQVRLETMKAKSVRAVTRSRLRKQYQDKVDDVESPVTKMPSATQLADEVEEANEVVAQDAVLGMLAVVESSVDGYKEACAAAAQSVSREISFRQAQMTARLR